MSWKKFCEWFGDWIDRNPQRFGAGLIVLVALISLCLLFGCRAEAASVVRINTGGNAYTDKAGIVWTTDSCTAGTTSTSTAQIAGTDDDALYQSIRYGSSFTCPITADNGDYTLRLHFAETYWTQVGQRPIDVLVDGTKKATIDILANAAQKTAYVHAQPVTVSGGKLTLTLTGAKNVAILSALELLPRSPPNIAALSWTVPTQNVDGSALTNLSGYVIRYGTTKGGPYTHSESVSASVTARDIKPPKSGTWYFVVHSKNSDGESTASAEISKLIRPATPTDGSITAPTNGAIEPRR